MKHGSDGRELSDATHKAGRVLRSGATECKTAAKRRMRAGCTDVKAG